MHDEVTLSQAGCELGLLTYKNAKLPDRDHHFNHYPSDRKAPRKAPEFQTTKDAFPHF